MKPSLLFLDIDGVLNSTQWNESRGRDPHKFDYDEGWMRTAEESLDVAAIVRLNRVVSATGCLVVLSSSWRKMDPLPIITRMLRYRDFQYHLFAATPHLPWPAKRGGEIKWWLDQLYPIGKLPPFAIVDDDDDMKPLMDHLVQTDNKVGLTDDDADRLIALLGRRES